MATRRLVEIVLKGKDETKGAFDSLASSLGVADAKALKLAAGAAAVGTALVTATKAVYDFTAQQAAAGDAAAKFAYRLGLTVEGLSELDYIAKRGNVSVRTMGIAMQRMTRRVAEAAQGLGEARDAIRELGIDAAAITSMSPDKQFYEIARALQDVTRQSDRVRLAFKLFDSEGVSVIQTLKGGLAETRKEFERFGGAMSASFASGSESFANAQSNLANATDRLKEALAEPFLAPFTQAINTLATVLGNGRDAAAGINNALASMPGIVGAYGRAATARPQAGRQVTDLEQWANSYGTGGGVFGMSPPTATVPTGPYNPGTYAPNPHWMPPMPMDGLEAMSPEDLGLMFGEVDFDLMRGMKEMEDFSEAAVSAAATFQSAMSSAFATAIMDAGNAAEAIRDIFVSTLSNLAGSFLSAGIFAALGLPVAGPFASVFGKSSVSGATKSMPGSAVLEKVGEYNYMAGSAYGKAFI